MKESGKRSSAWSMLALAGISIVGCGLVFTVHSVAAQNALCIVSCAAVAAVIVHRLYRASDVVDAALHLAEEMAKLGRELPDATGARGRERSDSLANVIPLPIQRAAVGQGLESPWYEDRP